jgi:hypothetical protein
MEQFQMSFYRTLTFMMIIGVILSGCSLFDTQQPGNNPNAIFTAAAHTLEAKLTQGVLLEPTSSLTPTIQPTGPSPTPTATMAQAAVTTDPNQACDAAKFVTDVTIPDGTRLVSGESFTKTWRFINIGTCTWDPSYTLVFDVGDLIGGPASLPLPGSVAPGQEVDLSVTLQAPSSPGSYRGYWRLRNSDGAMLPVTGGYNSKSFYVDIQVKSGGSSEKFTVTNVVFNVSHSGSCTAGIYTVTAKVTTNNAGEVSYMWKRSDGTDGSLNNGKLIFSAAGTQTISYDWSSGATGLSMLLYIDSPNGQDFGPALLNCP